MRLIVLGDIHGNLPALEVALREARAAGYDLICHSGDLVGFAPFPEETVDLVRTLGIAGVRGNVDEAIAAEAEGLGNGGEGGARAFEERAYVWTLQQVGRLTRRYLGNLPFERRLEIGGRRATLLHASPVDTSTRITEQTGDEVLRDLGDIADADMIIFGHTHRPFHRVVDGRHFINVGSVGYPQDGDPRTGFAIIRAEGNVEVRYERFPYDTGRLLRAAASRRFPPEARGVFKAA
jgi:putative phosphoesterase